VDSDNLDRADAASWQKALRLRHTAPGASVRFELDLSDVAADVVHAWLKYLYTQEDLSLIWPCGGPTKEAVMAAEKFWIDLLRLALRLGDDKLQLYAQDTLIGALSADNWTHFVAIAEQAQCRVLSEAALMMGQRTVLPAMLASFKVPTGLERDAGKHAKDEDRADEAEGLENKLPQAATVAGATPLTGGTVARGTVDLEVENHLMTIPAPPPGAEPASLLALKKASPSQFAEFKQRVAESITSSQKVAAQLQRCARYYDQHEESGHRSNDPALKVRWLKMGLAGLLLVFGLVPTKQRELLFSLMVSFVEPFRVWSSFLDIPLLAPLASGFVRVGLINAFMFVVLCLVVWSGLKT